MSRKPPIGAPAWLPILFLIASPASAATANHTLPSTLLIAQRPNDPATQQGAGTRGQGSGVRDHSMGQLVNGSMNPTTHPSIHPSTHPPISPSILLQGGMVIDGSGSHRRLADVRVAGGLIRAIGKLTPRPGERVIPAAGLVIAPGFIDTHSHADGGLFQDPD